MKFETVPDAGAAVQCNQTKAAQIDQSLAEIAEDTTQRRAESGNVELKKTRKLASRYDTTNIVIVP